MKKTTSKKKTTAKLKTVPKKKVGEGSKATQFPHQKNTNKGGEKTRFTSASRKRMDAELKRRRGFEGGIIYATGPTFVAKRNAFFAALENGLEIDTAAGIIGMNKSVLKKAVNDCLEKENPNEGEQAFIEKYHEAIAQCEAKMIEAIRLAAKEQDWRAGAWFLERKMPQQYGKMEKLEVTGKNGESLIPKEMLDDAIIRAQVKAMRIRRADPDAIEAEFEEIESKGGDDGEEVASAPDSE